MTDSPKGIGVELESGEWTPESAAKAAMDLHIPKRAAYARALALVSQKKEPL